MAPIILKIQMVKDSQSVFQGERTESLCPGLCDAVRSQGDNPSGVGLSQHLATRGSLGSWTEQLGDHAEKCPRQVGGQPPHREAEEHGSRWGTETGGLCRGDGQQLGQLSSCPQPGSVHEQN